MDMNYLKQVNNRVSSLSSWCCWSLNAALVFQKLFTMMLYVQNIVSRWMDYNNKPLYSWMP